jgi:hypothetical protein
MTDSQEIKFWWNRLEPSPSKEGQDDTLDLAAEVRDPAWMLSRQWQTGEFNGDNGGSLAYAEVSYRQGQFTDLTLGGSRQIANANGTRQSTLQGGASVSLGGETPAERLCSSEPFEPDTLVRIELAHRFEDEIKGKLADKPTLIQQAIAWFRSTYPLAMPTTGNVFVDQFNPLDAASQQMVDLAVGTVGDGYQAYELAQSGAFAPGREPPEALQPAVLQALAAFLTWATEIYGAIGFLDPTAWVPRELAFNLQAGFELDGVAGKLDAYPDADGTLDWGSFDVVTEPEEPTTDPATQIIFPAHVRFPGMPSARYWDFEEGDCSVLHIDSEERDLGAKLLVLDFVLNGCEDWYSFTLPIDVGNGKGKVVKVEKIVAHDVFGQTTTIDSANANPKSGFNRWSMFSLTKPTTDVTKPAIADILVIPPTAGVALMRRVPVEEVKFVRDDFANLVWGIEKTTPTALGVGWPGPERDTAIDKILPWPGSPSTDTTSPLRYELQSRIPSYWIPFLAVPEPIKDSTTTTKTALEEASMLRPHKETDTSPIKRLVVLPVGRILRPTKLPDQPAGQQYHVNPEEVLRTGTTVQRLVYRTRWLDGTCHVWMGRRRLAGAGEANSELRFDSALSTK